MVVGESEDMRGAGQAPGAFSCVEEIKGGGGSREKEWQSCRGKPTWMRANGTSALSRLVAIRYPKRLNYYAG